MKARTLLILLFSLSAHYSSAQIIVRGKIFRKGKDEVLFPVSVLNNNTGARNVSDAGGNYKIIAHKNDRIVFTYLGYYPDSFVVNTNKETYYKNIFLVPKTETLPSVDVSSLSKYQLDSLDRLRQFKYYLDKPIHNIINTNSHSAKGTGGFGLVLNPFTYFSKAERRKRHFRKIYRQYEKDAFIDSRFTKALVHHLTGLSGDSLAFFMDNHRPSYQFTRNASKLIFESWIMKQYEAYVKKPDD